MFAFFVIIEKTHDEVLQLVGHLRDHLQPVADEHLVRELMVMEPEGEDADNEHWSSNDWYCLECIKHLFRQRLMLWWRETKRQSKMWRCRCLHDMRPDRDT